MPRILAAIFAFAVLSMAPVLGALAQALPQEMVQQIGVAAEQGRQHRAAISDIIDERRQTANRQLETVVVAAISQRPVGSILKVLGQSPRVAVCPMGSGCSWEAATLKIAILLWPRFEQ